MLSYRRRRCWSRKIINVYYYYKIVSQYNTRVRVRKNDTKNFRCVVIDFALYREETIWYESRLLPNDLIIIVFLVFTISLWLIWCIIPQCEGFTLNMFLFKSWEDERLETIISFCSVIAEACTTDSTKTCLCSWVRVVCIASYCSVLRTD